MSEVLYLAVTNFLVGVLYYLVVVCVLVIPLGVPWLKRLGVAGAMAACFLSLFFFGCGSHHLDVATFFWTATNPMDDPHANLHSMVLWETLQILGAGGFILTLIFKGSFFLQCLQTPINDDEC